MNLSPKRLIKLLEEHGYVYKRTKALTNLFYNQNSIRTVIVPVHGGKDLKKGTFLAILKQAGIDKNQSE